jgi:hypothetical protein
VRKWLQAIPGGGIEKAIKEAGEIIKDRDSVPLLKGQYIAEVDNDQGTIIKDRDSVPLLKGK